VAEVVGKSVVGGSKVVEEERCPNKARSGGDGWNGFHKGIHGISDVHL